MALMVTNHVEQIADALTVVTDASKRNGVAVLDGDPESFLVGRNTLNTDLAYIHTLGCDTASVAYHKNGKQFRFGSDTTLASTE